MLNFLLLLIWVQFIVRSNCRPECHVITMNDTPVVGTFHGTFEPRDTSTIFYSFPQRDLYKTIMFHEIYEDLEIRICDGKYLKVALDDIPVDKSLLYYKHCTNIIDPRQNPVSSPSDKPIFVAIFHRPTNKLYPERGYIKLSDSTRPAFNFTYELNTVRSAIVDKSTIWTHIPCSFNGIPTLQYISGSYKFECKCMWGTSGPSCEWGRECSKERKREICKNRGECRQRRNHNICLCDPDHHGFDCAYYTWFTFLKKLSTPSCHFCHVLPTTTKCSCRHGYNLIDDKCVAGNASLHFNYTSVKNGKVIEDDIANEIKTCFPHVSQLSNNLTSRIHINTNSSSVTISNLDYRIAKEITESPKWNKIPKKCNFTKRSIRSDVQSNCKKDGVILRKPRMVPTNDLSLGPMSSSVGSHYVEIYCCYGGVVNFTFYKDDHIINEVPVNSRMTKEPVWQRGNLVINRLIGDPNGSANDTCMRLLIGTYDKEDLGIYKCKIRSADVESARVHYVSKYNMSMYLKPSSIAVHKGGNATVQCLIDGAPTSNYELEFNWEIYPPHVKMDVFKVPLRSELRLFNIQNKLKVTCQAIQKTNNSDSSVYFEEILYVYTIYENRPYCKEESTYKSLWKTTVVGTEQTIRCPKGYTGTCVRKCQFKEKNKAEWAIPDCSKCRNEKLYAVFKDVRMYIKGIESYIDESEKIFSNLRTALSSTNTTLPGEFGSLLQWIRSAMQISKIHWSFRDINEVINSILYHSNSLHQSHIRILGEILEISFNKWRELDCKHDYFKKRNLISYLRKRTSSFPNSILLSEREQEESTTPRYPSTRKASCSRPDIIRSKVVLHLTEDQTNSSMIAINLFRRPDMFINQLNAVFPRNNEDGRKKFGIAASPLIHLRWIYDDDVNNTNEPSYTSIEFHQCIDNLDRTGNIQWMLNCGRYHIENQWWNTSTCHLEEFSDGSCKCSCKSKKEEVVGLFCLKVNLTITSPPQTIINAVVAVGSGLSMSFLTITSVFLTFDCTFKAPETLPRLVEVLSLLVVNLVFFYESLVRTGEAEHLALLIAVSAGFVLSLGISVSHQVSLLQKKPFPSETRPIQLTTQPAFLVVIISILCSVMLGFILWTICTVQKISLSHTWLPDQGGSILTLVVLCYICGLLLLLLALAAFNYLRVKKMQVEGNYLAESLYAEYRNKCITNMFHFILILTSFYQERSVGKWFFFITCVTQSFLLMLFYTKQSMEQIHEHFKNHWKTNVNEKPKKANWKSIPTTETEDPTIGGKKIPKISPDSPLFKACRRVEPKKKDNCEIIVHSQPPHKMLIPPKTKGHQKGYISMGTGTSVINSIRHEYKNLDSTPDAHCDSPAYIPMSLNSPAREPLRQQQSV